MVKSTHLQLVLHSVLFRSDFYRKIDEFIGKYGA